MVKGKSKGNGKIGVDQGLRPIDAPHVEPDRTNISIKKADNGGHIINHYGSKGGKHFDKTLIANNSAHAKQILTGLIK